MAKALDFIDPDKLLLWHELDRGGHGAVHRATLVSSKGQVQEPVAAKVLSMKPLRTAQLQVILVPPVRATSCPPI